MKVRALKRFSDLKEKTVREIGDEFVVSRERYAEISARGRYVEEIKDDPEVKEVADIATGGCKKRAPLKE